MTATLPRPPAPGAPGPASPARGPLPLTPARVLTLVIGVPLVLLIIGVAGLSIVAWAAQGSYRVDQATAAPRGPVSVSISSGDATVQAGPGGRLQETGTVHYYLIRPTISWRHTAAGLHIGGGCLTIPLYPCRVSLHLTIPAGHPASVTDEVGILTADGLHGPVSLRTDVGNVRAIGLDGPTRITGRAGGISVMGMAGPA